LANPVQDPNWDFGRVKLAVRFTTEQRIVTKFAVRAFKSIESADIDLGSVNVFIGANGSGKSNLLEAFAILAAAAFGRIDNESIVRRGCRPGGYFRPLFSASPPDAETVLEAEDKETCYRVTLASPDSTRSTPWEFRREEWKHENASLVDRTQTGASTGDPQVGLAALKLAETAVGSPAAQFLKTLANYSIYAPNTPMLRAWMPDPQVREPIGLSGGRLSEAVSELMKTQDERGDLGGELRRTIEWFAGLGIMELKGSPQDPSTRNLVFLDRFFRIDQYPGTDRKHFYFLSANDVNEGVLYELFLAVLFLHPSAPRLFAVDNGDHGLNPLLARRLIEAMCRWLLSSAQSKQVLLTTHNPLVLDALPLQDERVRLFTVDRDSGGATNVRRFVLTDKHREMAAEGWTLSRMWVNKLISGVPDV
jgi:energy-coupling factor transporter ATP-binding protein EcfA2